MKKLLFLLFFGFVSWRIYELIKYHTQIQEDPKAVFYKKAIPFLLQDTIGFVSNIEDEDWTYYYCTFCVAPKLLVKSKSLDKFPISISLDLIETQRTVTSMNLRVLYQDSFENKRMTIFENLEK